MAREAYAAQVRLLIRLLPIIAREEAFALKGGTAINLFYRDLPRLSVDIDLTYLPVKERAASLNDIDQILERIARSIDGMPGVSAQRIAGGGGGGTRVQARQDRALVKIETSPVTRGVVLPTRQMRVSPAVEDEFGFAETQVVSFEDLYGGKIHAALDRQHPRDLYDIKLLYENEGLTKELFRVFLVYLASSNRPPHELLDPNLIDIADTHDREFAGMTRQTATLDDLLMVRDKLIYDIRSRLAGKTAGFLRAMQSGEPNFELIGLPDAANLPAIQWKLFNLRRLIEQDPDKHASQTDALVNLLQ